ncbi:MAG: dehydrogenase [Chloroflexi bacterium RBG_16_60_22]|nr:MAG: dehydrogenase [Chloroflexi bacterium RBG_16_60_22]
MADKRGTGKKNGAEKTFIKAMGLIGETGTGGSTVAVDVRDGKIVRLRPFHYDWKYRSEEFGIWEIHARGKVFRPRLQSLPSPHSLGYKKRVYSRNRVLHPLKRVDWDPGGQRNPEKRGESKYVRISWDEALDIITSELKRVQKKYGPSAVLLQGDGHGETGVVHPSHACPALLLKHMGGYTLQTRNPDSWEGFYWGAKHAWGMDPVGIESQTNMVPDIAENCELILYWGCDPETTSWAFHGQAQSRVCYWLGELGIKGIFICPDLNYGAAVHADKWIPILPNTDAAMRLAIAYVWITEGTYDKDYVATHTYGFDKFADYVLGKEDGIAKTPGWAAELCGVPSRIIKALAREWASRRTSISHYLGGGAIRGPYSTEPARLEVLLLAMQGLGKPGVHQFCFNQIFLAEPFKSQAMFSPQVAYRGTEVPFQAAEIHGISRNDFIKRWDPAGWTPPPLHKPEFGLVTPPAQRPSQIIAKDLIHEAILNPPVSWYGTTFWSEPLEDQFVKYTYPARGCSEVHMIWTDTPCWITCWNDSNYFIKAIRSPKIEFILAQQPWLENDCQFADVILPVSTKFEEEDIQVDAMSEQFDVIFHEGKCIEPVGESKSDYEIVCLIADRLGLRDKVTGGKTEEQWIKYAFDNSGAEEFITYKEWREKGYYISPTLPEARQYVKRRTPLQDFYEDPEGHPLKTPSGKVEFYSQNLARHFPGDKERPPVPHWIPYGETHQESRLHPRAKKYPLLVVSNHGRWRVHANLDDITWIREIETCKVKGQDGYLYEPLWMNQQDAAARGIQRGDVVKIYNERGAVLAGAYVTERIMPGVVSIDHGARYDPIVPGELDRGGAINTITPRKTISKNATGMVCAGFLVAVERANLDELKRKYHQAFNRPYDPGAGLTRERVLHRGEKI